MWKNGAYSWGSWGGGTGGNWDGWFDSFKKRDERNKKRKRIKSEIETRSKETFSPVKVSFNSFNDSSFNKRRKLSVNLNDDGIDRINVDDVFNAYDRMPNVTDRIDNYIMHDYLLGKCKALEGIGDSSYFKGSGGYIEAQSDLRDFFKGNISYNDMKEKYNIEGLKEIWAKEGEPSQEINEEDGNAFQRYQWRDVDKKYEGKYRKLIDQKIVIKEGLIKEESLKKGKRINRGYIQQTSYKPLSYKTKTKGRQKNILVIIDASGSMEDGSNMDGTNIEQSASFASAMFHSDKINVHKTILHSSYGWYDINRWFEKGKIKIDTGGGEDFSNIGDNLEQSFLKGVDYVVVLTDLCIGERCQQGLYDYIKTKKHMVISFQREGDLKGLPVRVVKSMKDIVNALSTLIG